MTPSADSTLPLTRVTIAGLEDLGYKVNYGSAESYQAESLAAGCRCNRRLGDTSNSTHQSTKYRELSEEGKQIAVDYGKSLMAENRAQMGLIPGDGDVPDLGGEMIYVIYEETDGGIHSIMVRQEE